MSCVGLLSSVEPQRPLPVTCLTDTVYPATGRLRAGCIQDRVTEVAVNTETLTSGGLGSKLMIANSVHITYK